MDKRMELFKKYLDRTNMDHKEYQYEGVKWCLNNELCATPLWNVRGGFIADEMGLGKTIMMIGTFLCNYLPKTLIIVPPVLIHQWYDQIFKTTGHESIIYHGQNKKFIDKNDLQNATIVISTYGEIAIKNDEKNPKKSLLFSLNWSRVVFDEAHHLRNKTNLFFGVVNLKRKITWLVSGTPIQNKKSDFYNLCSILKINKFYYSNNSNLIKLAKTFILKRTKKQVGIIIPDLNIETKIIKWKNKKELDLSQEIHSKLEFTGLYDNDSKLANAISNKGRALLLLLRARQCCILPRLMSSEFKKLTKNRIINFNEYKEGFLSSSKLDIVIQTILANKDNGNGKLIFCHFKEEIDEIERRLNVAGMLNIATFDGRTSYHERDIKLTQKFIVLILQIQTGCEGLNLQKNYSEIYFVSPHWNPAVEDQAIARCHRIGQEKPVSVIRFEMDNFGLEYQTKSMENYVSSVQSDKRSIAYGCMNCSTTLPMQ